MRHLKISVNYIIYKKKENFSTSNDYENTILLINDIIRNNIYYSHLLIIQFRNCLENYT